MGRAVWVQAAPQPGNAGVEGRENAQQWDGLQCLYALDVIKTCKL